VVRVGLATENDRLPPRFFLGVATAHAGVLQMHSCALEGQGPRQPQARGHARRDVVDVAHRAGRIRDKLRHAAVFAARLTVLLSRAARRVETVGRHKRDGVCLEVASHSDIDLGWRQAGNIVEIS
jgi:hypothetical protein